MVWYDELYDQLKPCPFCATSNFGFYRSRTTTHPDIDYNYFHVICKNCGVSSAHHIIAEPSTDEKQVQAAAQQALKSWNQRHVEIPKYDLVEAYKAVVWQLHLATYEIDARRPVDTQHLRDLITNLEKMELVDPKD